MSIPTSSSTILANRIAPAARVSEPEGLTPALTALFAVACGIAVANLYYAQTLVGLIAHDLHLSIGAAGFVVTLTQLGYGAGLFFIVGLGDLIENRRLFLLTCIGVILSLIGVISSDSPAVFLLFSFTLGMCSVGAQILIPLSVHLAPERKRGRVIGNIMGGLLAGIMLARPVASFLAAHFGWRAAFELSAVIMLLILVLLWRYLPRRQPTPGLGYRTMLISTLRLLARSRPLQRRAAYQATLFTIFNMFWTGVPLLLHERFGLGQQGIALFALAGAGGALAAPVAGRLADHGYTRSGTAVAILCVLAAILLTGRAAAAGSLLILVAAAIALDASVQANQIFSQRIVFSLNARARARINAAYMTTMFLCGAFGSVLGSLTYSLGGWWLTSAVAAVLAVLILLVFATEYLQVPWPSVKGA